MVPTTSSESRSDQASNRSVRRALSPEVQARNLPPGPWRPVGDTEYKVSAAGLVMSPRGRVLKPVARGRYLGYAIGRGNLRYAHEIVAEAFHGARPDGQHARHLNGDRFDNRAENLAWGTRSENMLDAVAHGTHPQASKTHCKNGHEFTPENTRIRPGTTWRACRACERDNTIRRRTA